MLSNTICFKKDKPEIKAALNNLGTFDFDITKYKDAETVEMLITHIVEMD